MIKARQQTALPWGFLHFDVYKHDQRPTSSLPHSTVLRLQVFSTSWRLIPVMPFQPCFVLNPSMRFELSEVSPSLMPPRLAPQRALLPRMPPSLVTHSRRSEDFSSSAPVVGSSLNHSEEWFAAKPDSSIWLKDSYTRKVHSRRIGFTRVSPADPLSALFPFKDFSPRVSASHLCETSSCGLCHESGQVQIHSRSLECQRTQGLA